LFFSVAPLIVCPLCFYVVVKKANWGFGLISMLATGLLTLAIMGFRPLLLIEYCLFTVPHSILVCIIFKLEYNQNTGIVRLLLIAGLSLLSSTVAVLFFFDIFGYQGLYGLSGMALYIAVYVLNAMVLVFSDYAFTRALAVLLPRLFHSGIVLNQTVDIDDIFE